MTDTTDYRAKATALLQRLDKPTLIAVLLGEESYATRDAAGFRLFRVGVLAKVFAEVNARTDAALKKLGKPTARFGTVKYHEHEVAVARLREERDKAYAAWERASDEWDRFRERSEP